MSNKISITDLRELIHKGEATDPLCFLESVMNGQDPRKQSSIYQLVMEIDDFTGGDITHADWSELVDHVITHNKFHSVSLTESVNASKTLAEYLFAKRKQIDITDNRDGAVIVNSPLSVEEIELFKETFNDEF